MLFRQLPILIPEIDEAFEDFYQTLLKELRFSVFFSGTEQIRSLVIRQKQHFAQMIHSPSEVIEVSYIRLGEYHYDFRIPYVDFIRGTEILEKHFLLHAQSIGGSMELFNEIFDFFRIVKSYTAKGYLNRMILEDRRDIELFFRRFDSEEETYLPRKIVLQKIEWLENLLNVIESGSECSPENCQEYFAEWLDSADFLTLEKRQFLEELDKRIQINTQNLFYFLKHGDYLEMLPLYTSLLNIYKLTLLLNNSITYEYANHLIGDLKIDKLTNLYRKEAFEQFLYKELELGKRDKDYSFAVVFIDIDDFKGINDQYGHYSGDKVLETIGKAITDNIRSSDIGCRIGGDELALILKNIRPEQAMAVMRKILSTVNDEIFIFNDDQSFQAGLSIGIILNSEDCFETITDIVKAVDKKLYTAKQEGKNRIAI
ncbi:MAG: GGDEF domain-containing protein [Sulfuricurvum sp.]